jgi:hypothetical protein
VSSPDEHVLILSFVSAADGKFGPLHIQELNTEKDGGKSYVVKKRRRSLHSGTPTKRQVSKRQVSKCLVSKRPVSKRQACKTSGLQNVRGSGPQTDKHLPPSTFVPLLVNFLRKADI